MNKPCKICLACIRAVKIDPRSGAIHQDHYCLKKRKYVKMLDYEIGAECKYHKEKQEGKIAMKENEVNE